MLLVSSSSRSRGRPEGAAPTPLAQVPGAVPAASVPLQQKSSLGSKYSVTKARGKPTGFRRVLQKPPSTNGLVPAEPRLGVSFLQEQRGDIYDNGWVTAKCPQLLSVAMPLQLEQGAGEGLCCVSLG